MNNLTIVVKEEHLSFFYTLMGRYHAGPSDFVTTYERLGMGNDGNIKGPGISPGESSQDRTSASEALSPEKTQSFYSYITGECTCGTCYKKFARPDRVPWRSSAGSNVFTNSKYGIIRVTNCPVANFVGCGYIYESVTTVSSQIKLEECNARREIAIRKERATLKEVEDKAKITALKVSEAKAGLDAKVEKNNEAKRATERKAAKERLFAQELEKQNDAEFKIWNNAINAAVNRVPLRREGEILPIEIDLHGKTHRISIHYDVSGIARRDATRAGKPHLPMGQITKQKAREQILACVGSYRFSKHDQLITARATVTKAQVKHDGVR